MKASDNGKRGNVTMFGVKYVWRVVFQDNSYTVFTAKTQEKVLKMLENSNWRHYHVREVCTIGKA